MTQPQKNYLKDNWLTLANFILLGTILVQVTIIYTDLKNSIDKNKKEILTHEKDYSIHMSFEKKIEVFVPRIELDARLDGIKDQLDRIEKKLK